MWVMTEDVRVVALPSEEPARVWVAIKGMGCEGVGLVDCGMEPPGKYLRCRAVRDQGKLVRSCWKIVQGREQLEIVEDRSCTKLRPVNGLGEVVPGMSITVSADSVRRGS